MRARVPIVALAVGLLFAGCVQSWERRIDEARNRTPQESTALPNASNDSAPTVTSPTPAAAPTPTEATPTRAHTPTPPPSSTPTPAPPTPTSPTPPAPTPWPHEGSFVIYTMEHSRSFTGSDQWYRSYANATWTYQAGDWRGTCEGTIYDHRDPRTLNVTTVHRAYTASSPPHWPIFDTRTPPAVGQNVTTWFLDTCAIVNETHTFAGGNATTFRAGEESMPFAFNTTWSRASGLVLTWTDARYGLAPNVNVGHLVATDAPD